MKQKLLLFIFLAGTSSVFFFSLFSYLSVANPKQNMFYELNSKIPPGALHSFLGSLPFFQPYPSKNKTTKQTETVYQTAANSNTPVADVFATGNDLKLNSLQLQAGIVAAGVGQFNGGIITNGGNIDAGSGAIKASNILYGATAGNGISVGTGQNPLISNTGVLSLQNQTGALSLSAGSGIGINGLTISNNDAGSSQNIFKNIGVSGQSTITAGANNDTLTFIPGSNITMATDTTNKSLTINAAAASNASGWTRDLTINAVYLQNTSDYVGIGTSNPTATLEVVGNASTSGNLTFRGGGAQQINLLNGSSLGFYGSAGGDSGLTSTPGLYIANSGNIGIGVSNPTAPLQVNGYFYGAGGIVTTNNVSTQTYTGSLLYDSSVLGLSNDVRIRLGGTSNPSGFGISRRDTAFNLWAPYAGGLGIGTTSLLGTLDVRANSGTLAIASVSGQTSFAALTVDNSGVGDLFTASNSGSSKFTITNDGTVVIGSTATPLANSGLDIEQNGLGNAVLAMNQKGSGDLFTASSSGTPKFLMTNNGTSYFGAGGVVATNNVVTQTYTAALQYDVSLLGLSNDLRIRLGGTSNPSGFGISQRDTAFNLWAPYAGGLGIGTTSPVGAFDVRGLNGTTSVASISGQTAKASLVVNNDGVGSLFTASSSGTTKFTIANDGSITTQGNLTVNGNLAATLTPSSTAINLGSSGSNFGTVYAQNLVLSGTSGQGGFWQLNSGVLSPATITNSLAIGQTTALANSGLDIEQSGLGNSVFVINQKSSGDIFTASASGTPKFIMTNNGTSYFGSGGVVATNNVSTQTYTAAYQYDVSLLGLSNDFRIRLGGTSNPSGFGISQRDTTFNLWAPYAGGLGIGTTSPVGGLDVRGLNGTTSVASISGQTSKASLVVNNDGVGDLFTASASSIPVFKIDTNGNTRVGGSLCVKGTLSSACAGSSIGTIYATNTTVQSADVAENYISSQSLEPGDVIMPANDGNNQAVIKTTRDYQSQAIGIVSTNPGVTLNSDAKVDATHPNLYPIALQGRVPVKVSSQNGTIQAGDLLTSSSIPGVAMKATKAGQIIGKALEAFTNTDAVGKIMVFVNISWADPTVQITDSGDLSVNGQVPGANTTTPVTTNTLVANNTFSPNTANPDQFTTLSTTVSQLQSQIASLSAQMTKWSQLDDLSKQVADLDKTINLTQTLQGIGTQSAVLGASPSSGDTTIGRNLNVLGKTTLSDLGVTGKLSMGLLTIDGMDTSSATSAATINTLSGSLKFQSLGLNGVDFINGKVTIDTDGNLVTQGDITAKTINADKVQTGSLEIKTDNPDAATVGEALIPAGQTKLVVKTTAITDKSQVFITVKGGSPIPVSVIAQTSGTSFTVVRNTALNTDTKFSWWIVNEQ